MSVFNSLFLWWRGGLDSGNEELQKMGTEPQLKIEGVKAEQVSENGEVVLIYFLHTLVLQIARIKKLSTKISLLATSRFWKRLRSFM